MDIRCHRWTNASLADAAAMVCYAMLRRQVEQVSGGKASGALHNTLLKAIPQLVSGEPVQHLWELSRAVRADAALRTLFECEAESVVDQIAVNPEFADFRARFDEYLQRWGFRCSAELMLTAPSFQEQPELLVETIRAYARLRSANRPPRRSAGSLLSASKKRAAYCESCGAARSPDGCPSSAAPPPYAPCSAGRKPPLPTESERDSSRRFCTAAVAAWRWR